MSPAALRTGLAGALFFAAACTPPAKSALPPRPSDQPGSGAPTRPATPAREILAEHQNGRLEQHGGLRLLRLWGDPGERGAAHAALLGAEACELLRKELGARFAKRKQMLKMARLQLPMLLRFPKPLRAEIKAFFGGVRALGIDLHMPAFGRDIDLRDWELINAMDTVGLMGCSGFTLVGDQVEGGGVLTARNFDWPVTGPYLADNCILLVQHPEDGQPHVSVTWPGYLCSVTGVNAAGVATFLHVGDSPAELPKPGTWPTAAVTRRILSEADAASAFRKAEELLQNTTPPVGYLVRIVTPDPEPGRAYRVFEADRQKLTWRQPDEICLVTNHFTSRTRDKQPGRNSSFRMEEMAANLNQDLAEADQKVSVAEAWEALARVQVDGLRFATLHSLVFRHEPFHFELRISEVDSDGSFAGAPGSPRRYVLDWDALFKR